MAETTDSSDLSACSSPLSSPPTRTPSPPADTESIPSSPLSTLSSTPEPPDDPDFAIFANMKARVQLPPYPSPPASQQTSQSGSPCPDGMDSGTDKDGPPPAKRRRISRDPKDRTTEYIDLRSGKVSPDELHDMDRVLNVLHKRQKIVVIAGAGMSKSAGVPDFRSKQGLFSTLKKQHNLKGSGQHLFDASVYKDDASTNQFHHMISEMSRLTKAAKPTPFHHMLATIAKEGRLMRLYSQNVDCLETNMEPLQTRTPLTKDETGKWPRTLQLHGGLDKMVCIKCHEISDLDAQLFEGSDAPLCPSCEVVNNIRTNIDGKRSHGIGRLRPRMVLYHEAGPDEEAIGAVVREDLRRKPDAVIVVGTTMKVKGLQRIVKEMCGVVRDRRDGGLAIWINLDPPPASQNFKDLFDIVVQGTSDEVADRAAMRKWYEEPTTPNDFSEVSEADAAKAATKKGEVVIPKCPLTEAPLMNLPSAAHINNSFRPPAPDATPMKDPDTARPGDWSPLTSRRSSVLQSIECDWAPEGDNITVSREAGLMTPSKSQRSTPAKKTPALPSINEKLKDAGKAKKPAVKTKSPTAATKKGPVKSSIKYVKPAASAKSKTTSRAKASKSIAKPNASLTGAFTQSKSAATAAKNDVAKKEKLPATPRKTPSKLRQVSNASVDEPLMPLPSQDARNNTSPSKTSPSKTSPSKTSPSKQRAFFPGLATENAGHALKRKSVGA